MIWFIVGLTLWIGIHLFPSAFPDARSALVNRLGLMPYKGLYALLIVSGLVCIVMGWKATPPEHIYTPIAALRHPAMLLVVLGFVLMVSAKFPATRIKRFVRHPQLTGALLWAIAHLMANGDSRSVVLFTSIGIWTIVMMVILPLLLYPLIFLALGQDNLPFFIKLLLGVTGQNHLIEFVHSIPKDIQIL